MMRSRSDDRTGRRSVTRDQAERWLRRAVGSPKARFRPGQWEAIDLIANHRYNLTLVQRTGWGKSSVYFISTRILRDRGYGLTLIVSPLLALMRNQIESARRLGIRAETINSSNPERWNEVRDQVLYDNVDALLISPERLANESFVESLLMPVADRIGLLVVDEVHCISDWGHDFRPDYRRLSDFLRQLPPNTRVLGTTATANDRVVEDARSQLGEMTVRRGPLERRSIALQTLRMPSQAERLAWLAQHVPNLPGTGIVYVLTTRDADQVAAWLTGRGIDARAYYANVKHEGFADSNSYRLYLEDLLLNNRIKALVATSALGMGYDKPDIGFTIHYQAPSSVIAYYQQVGRAGRSLDNAVGVLLAGREDSEIAEYFRKSAFPPEKDVYRLLSALEASDDGLSLAELERVLNLRRGQVQKVLKTLSVERPSPVFKSGPKWLRTPVWFAVDRERIRRLTEQRGLEWGQLQEYIDTKACLMQYLREALDDSQADECGRCANCIGRPVIPPSADPSLALEAVRFLRRCEIPFEPRKLVPPGALHEYRFGSRSLGALRVSEGRILSRWGDAGWGAMVAADKEVGNFRDELVAAMAEMVRRWRPQPAPEWVTCVPSHRSRDLVPSLARRLARRLRLPFRKVVRERKQHEPQNAQQNSFHQCSNLDGAFRIAGTLPASPLLLVDDVIDSRWTVTVVGALLRQAGSGAVYPVALASGSPSS